MTHIYSRAYIDLNKLELLKSEIAWFSSHGHPLEASAFQAQARAASNASEAERVIRKLSLGGDKIVTILSVSLEPISHWATSAARRCSTYFGTP